MESSYLPQTCLTLPSTADMNANGFKIQTKERERNNNNYFENGYCTGNGELLQNRTTTNFEIEEPKERYTDHINCETKDGKELLKRNSKASVGKRNTRSKALKHQKQSPKKYKFYHKDDAAACLPNAVNEQQMYSNP